MTQHTSGPWAATGWEGIVVNDSKGNTLALAPGSSYHLEEMKANARLIAAAPDMLAALEKLSRAFDLDEYDQDRAHAEACAMREARDAIAKAKGGEPCGK